MPAYVLHSVYVSGLHATLLTLLLLLLLVLCLVLSGKQRDLRLSQLEDARGTVTEHLSTLQAPMQQCFVALREAEHAPKGTQQQQQQPDKPKARLAGTTQRKGKKAKTDTAAAAAAAATATTADADLHSGEAIEDDSDVMHQVLLEYMESQQQQATAAAAAGSSSTSVDTSQLNLAIIVELLLGKTPCWILDTNNAGESASTYWWMLRATISTL